MPSAQICSVFDQRNGRPIVAPPSEKRAVRENDGDSAAQNARIQSKASAAGQRQEVSDEDISERRVGRRHYIAETLRNQELTLEQCARKLGVSVDEAARQSEPDSNLTLSQLFDWSEVLDVPLPELLPFDSNTSDPIRNRALLLRVMKTARQLQRSSRNTPFEYVATTLVDQLLEIVPEFAVVEPWPSVGKSRVAKSEGLSARRVDHETSRFIEENYR